MSRLRRRLRNACVLFAGVLVSLLILDRAFPPNLPDVSQDYARVVVDRHGVPLRAFADQRGVWRYAIDLEAVSPTYLEALLSYEDRLFWHHPGINPVAMLRAARQNLRNGRVVSGGSTLTQQVARLLHPRPRTLRGKLGEMLRAIQLEWRFSKREILTLYVNHAPFGGTLEGVQAASFGYLGKPASELTDAEAALLAVLPQAPGRLRPDRNPQGARAARDKVLQRLRDLGVWDNARVADAKLEIVYASRLKQPLHAPLLARRLVRADRNRAVIRTTIDADLQMGLESYVRDYVARFSGPVSAAVLVLDSASLEVLAYLGSADFGNNERAGHVDMVNAVRSPGSTLKPFIYGLAIDEGLIHSHSLLIDAPRTRARYRPANFSGGFNGPVSTTDALRRSLNLPAVQVLEAFGPGRFADRLANAGLRLQLPDAGRASIAVGLGGAGVRLESLAGTYAALSRAGLAGAPRVLQDQPLLERRLLSPGAAWIVRRMLTSPVDTGFVTRRSVGWKTGTSYGYRDAWAVGFDGAHTVAVWTGRPDATPHGEQTGASAAVPLLRGVMDHLPLPTRAFPEQPSQVAKSTICWPLGTALSAQRPEHCHRRVEAWLLDGVAPPTLPSPDDETPINPLPIWTDQTGRFAVSERCRSAGDRVKTAALWPRALEPWIPDKRRRQSVIGAPMPTCDSAYALSDRIVIEGISPGSRLRMPAGSTVLPSIVLSSRGGMGRRDWFVNGRLSYRTGPGETVSHRVTRVGTHQFAVVDESGQTDVVEISMLRG